MGGRKGLVGEGSELTRRKVKRVKDLIEMLDLVIFHRLCASDN